MQPSTYDLSIFKGSVFRQGLIWEDDSGTPIDLSGSIVRLRAYKSSNKGALVVDLSSETGDITLGGATGTIDLYISATDTESMNFGQAVYSLEHLPGGSEADRVILLHGVITLDKETVE